MTQDQDAGIGPTGLSGLEILQENIGSGGSAVVHKAIARSQCQVESIPANALVAVKEYRRSITSLDGQLDRIKQEAAIGELVSHPNFVKIYGAHIPEDPSTDQCYLFMEWVEGETLDLWGHNLRKNVAWEKLRQIADDIAQATEALHQAGVHHRDIKPENVLVSRDRAKLMDIGVAELTGNNDHTLHTQVKDFVGSVRYASPQFIMDGTFTEKDDIYSLGATTLELFTGMRPYHEVERKPVLPIHVAQSPPSIERLRDNVPASMRVLLEGCLNPDPKRRPSLSQFREVLNGEEGGYIQEEIRKKNAEERGYKIISLDASQGGFYADIADDEPEIGEEYTVVRKVGKTIQVPSLNADVEPEMWIATAELRHTHQCVGYFKLVGKRWIPGRLTAASQLMGSGHWEEFDKHSEPIKIGDLVLKRELSGRSI